LKSVQRIAMEHWLNVGSSSEIEEWAGAVARSGTADRAVLEILRGQRSAKKDLFMRHVLGELGFEPVSADGAREALLILRDLAKQVLAGELHVNVFCSVVQQLDGAFMESEHMPQALARSYAGCDWCDESSKLEDLAELRNELEKLVSEA
jgi:hypothetical protein